MCICVYKTKMIPWFVPLCMFTYNICITFLIMLSCTISFFSQDEFIKVLHLFLCQEYNLLNIWHIFSGGCTKNDEVVNNFSSLLQQFVYENECFAPEHRNLIFKMKKISSFFNVWGIYKQKRPNQVCCPNCKRLHDWEHWAFVLSFPFFFFQTCLPNGHIITFTYVAKPPTTLRLQWIIWSLHNVNTLKRYYCKKEKKIVGTMNLNATCDANRI